MPARKSHKANSILNNPSFSHIPDDQIYQFKKGEIVWAKMKFFSAWPAQVSEQFMVRGEDYKKKKPLPPKQKVMFFDNPPTIGEIHHNQIFKFADNFKKFAATNNKKLQLGISQAKRHLNDEELITIGDVPKIKVDGKSKTVVKSEKQDESIQNGKKQDDSVSHSSSSVQEFVEVKEQIDTIGKAGGEELIKQNDHVMSIQASIEDKEQSDQNSMEKEGNIDQIPNISDQQNFKIEDIPNVEKSLSENGKQVDHKIESEKCESVKSEDEQMEDIDQEKEKTVDQEEENVNVEAEAEVKQETEDSKEKPGGMGYRSDLSPISTKPKRRHKPTMVYEIFQKQQQHNKRVKKQNEKEREQRRQQQQAGESERQPQRQPRNVQRKNFEAESSPEDYENDQRKDIVFSDKRRLSSFDLDASKKNRIPGMPRTNSVDYQNDRPSIGTPKLDKKSSVVEKNEKSRKNPKNAAVSKEQSVTQPLMKLEGRGESSKCESVQNPQNNVRQINKEKICNMKEIKKYFDQFFKEIKDLQKEILALTEQQLQDPTKKKDIAVKYVEAAELLKNMITKCYRKIQLNIKDIDQQISLIFREYNELALIHESKLGHALKDMQQFLVYYQSSDEEIQTVLSKLDLICEMQEKKMQIEIFGESPIDQSLIRKHLKTSCDQSGLFLHPIQQSSEKTEGSRKNKQRSNRKRQQPSSPEQEMSVNQRHSETQSNREKLLLEKRQSGSVVHSSHKKKSKMFKRRADDHVANKSFAKGANGGQIGGLLYQNIIQNHLKQKQHLLQQNQSKQLSLMQMQQQINNFQNIQNNQMLQPSQSLNLTILNNGQNFMSIPGNQQIPLQMLGGLQQQQKMQHQMKLVGNQGKSNGQNPLDQGMNINNISNLNNIQNIQNLNLLPTDNQQFLNQLNMLCQLQSQQQNSDKQQCMPQAKSKQPTNQKSE